MPVEKYSTLPTTAIYAEQRGTAARGPRILVVLAFLAIYLLWGSTYLAIRFAVETIPPLLTAGVRQLTAGTLLLAWCFWKGQRPNWNQWRASFVIGFLFFLIGHGTLHWAEQRVPSGLAAVLIATEPIWIFALSSAAAKKWRVNPMLLAGLLLGLAGVGLLFQGRTMRADLIGAAAILVGAISWSAGIVYSRRSHLSGHPVLLSAMSLVSGGAMLLIASASFGEWSRFAYNSVSNRSLAALAYLILFGSIVAFTAYNWLMERYSPTLIATHTYVNPVVAILLGWWLASERVTLSMAAAAAMVLVAILLVERGSRSLALN